LNISKERANVYQTIVYDKSAWALVNLRKISTLSSPPDTMHSFYDGLKDFIKTYYGKKASTDDFRVIMEKHLKMDLKWFFKQYFEDTTIPTVDIKSRIEKSDTGYKVIVDATQDTDFRLYIPVEISFGEKKSEVIFRMDGKQGHQEFSLVDKPKSVKIDPLNEAVARIKD
jgi:aminopeptidase N